MMSDLLPPALKGKFSFKGFDSFCTFLPCHESLLTVNEIACKFTCRSNVFSIVVKFLRTKLKITERCFWEGWRYLLYMLK